MTNNIYVCKPISNSDQMSLFLKYVSDKQCIMKKYLKKKNILLL